MNQSLRIIKRMCIVCNHNITNVRQIYNQHISDYEDCEMPICYECEKTERLNRYANKK